MTHPDVFQLATIATAKGVRARLVTTGDQLRGGDEPITEHEREQAEAARTIADMQPYISDTHGLSHLLAALVHPETVDGWDVGDLDDQKDMDTFIQENGLCWTCAGAKALVSSYDIEEMYPCPDCNETGKRATTGDLTNSAYMQADLGTHTVISGGDVMELGPQDNESEIPF